MIEFKSYVANIAHAPAGIFLKTSLEQTSHVGRRRVRQCFPIGLVAKDRRNGVGDRLTREGLTIRYHFVEHAPKRPDICTLVERLSSRLFRTHVSRRAQDQAFLRSTSCY